MESDLIETGSSMPVTWGKLDPAREKVYAIVAMQLLCTAIIGGIFLTPPFVQFSKNNNWLGFSALVIALVLVCVLSCFQSIARTYPTNLIILSAFTIAFAIAVGIIVSSYEVNAVVMALSATAVIVFGLTMAACCGAFLLAMMLGLICLGILNIFFYSQFMNTLYASIGAIVMSMYIVFDTQILMIGRKQNTLGPDDYIIGALNLYLDIINLFLYLLALFADKNNKN